MDIQRERLTVCLRKYVGNAKIDDDTRLYHDLSISGDNASELIDDIHREFKTDLIGMRFWDYFPEEADAFLEHIGRLLGFRSRRKPLTVAHLSLVVKEGSWREPSAAAEVGPR
jgi:hypothetical protein